MLRPSLDDQNTTIRSARTLEACHVYLCSHPIPCGSLLMGLASSSTSQCGNLWHKHWVVIFDFGEREVFVCDATKDSTGELKGRVSWEEKTYVHKNAYSYERHLGQQTLLKEHVEKVVKEIRYMGKYHFKNNNCQKWAQKLLDHLEISVPRDMPDAQTVYERAKPSVFAALSGIVGIGVSLLLGVVLRVHS
ncbi:uncharacterized protein LOC142803866 [Rhipicephalus microplus]|uniref:uncharacterized protein LOC142803866 n=1 Tax=Rhipicephalus microplus TaxID=6941 RepID=UPI003F6D0196